MTDVKNTTPDWKTSNITHDPTDTVPASTVAAALGQKVDAVNGEASGLQMDDRSTWGGKTLGDIIPSQAATAIATLNGQSGTATGALASVTALDAPLPATADEGTGVVRVDVYEDDWSDYGRACQMMRLSSLSQTLRTWARETQRTARLKAGATV